MAWNPLKSDNDSEKDPTQPDASAAAPQQEARILDATGVDPEAGQRPEASEVDDGEQGDVTETAQPSEADATPVDERSHESGDEEFSAAESAEADRADAEVARPEGEGEGDGERQTRGSTAAPVIGAAGGAVAAGAATTEPEAGPPLYRDVRAPRQPIPDTTDVQPVGDDVDPVRVEQDRLDAERRARREARAAALAPMADERATKIVPAKPQKKTTDKFWASLGLFLLRVVVAGTMGVHGVQKLLNIPATTDFFANTILPYPRYVAIGVGALEVAVAVALLFGMLTRLAGLGLTLLMAGALGLVVWGNWSIIQPGTQGFVGEHELLLATVGLLFLILGAGAWSVDGSFRRRRDAVRAEREAMVG